MKRYWVVAPYRSDRSSYPDWSKGMHTFSDKQENIFEEVWRYDLKNETIALGWSELGDTSRLSKDEFRQRFKNTFPDSKQVQYAVWKLYNEISPGDVIIARRGRKKMIGIGTVTGKAFYAEEKGRARVPRTDDLYPNFINVEWENKEEIEFDNQVFGMGALCKINEDKYHFLIEEKTSEKMDR